MTDRPEDRRRFGRVHLKPMLHGEVDLVQVSVVEVSVIGARVAHEARIPRSGTHRLRFKWDDNPIEYDCEVVRSTLTRGHGTAQERMIYESGIRFVKPHHSSGVVLRDLVSSYVLRAINQQIANARGLPPIDGAVYETGPSGRYRRCELVNGTWRKSETTSPEQPPLGFTISAEVDRHHVDLLCRTFEICDPAARELTRIFAQLSIAGNSDTPLRQYVP